MGVRENYDVLVRSLQQAAEYSSDEVTTLFQELEFTPDEALEFIVSDKGKELGLNILFNADDSIRSYQYINSAGQIVTDRVNELVPYYNSNLGTPTGAASSLFNSTISTSTVLGVADTVLSLGSVNHYTPQTPLQQTLAMSARFAPPVQLASVACRLGKAIDGTIYDLATAIGLHPPEELNPATWDGIVSNDDGALAQAFNWLLELDGEGGINCYADEESVAYCAQWLNQENFFSTGEGAEATYNGSTAAFPNPSVTSVIAPTHAEADDGTYAHIDVKVENGYIFYGNSSGAAFAVATDSGTAKIITTTTNYRTGRVSVAETYLSLNTTTYNGTRYYYGGLAFNSRSLNITIPRQPITDIKQFATILFDGTITSRPAVPGIIDNGGTVPDTSTWTDTDATLESLKTQYPDWFNDRLEVDTVQPDGSTKHYNYIKVEPPYSLSTTGNPDTQTQPAESESVKSETSTLTQLQTLIEALTQSLTKGQELVNPDNLTEEEQKTLPDGSNATNTTVDNNPPDTGEGNAPGVVVPTGEASSLWAVYHPTQSQLNAFGSWLWSSDFVEQIKRLFNDPMQAVIGVHKVFAPIPTGGTRTIVCGYLDSGVSSATVSSQYTEVDCGTVDCREYFGNVFDYDPHTKVSIYLPFIGVVPLKVSEVMRSTINVTYGVDVITGACLAKVKVTRDGGGGILYSYGGSCACHYPISSGSYAGIISGIVTSAIGIAGGIATGNPIAAIGGAMAGLHQAHTDVQRSGGFTGCAGAMGPKKPYLIIDRPQTKLATNFETYQGKPANSTQFIGDCTGFIRATEVHFSAPGAFDDEAKEVEALLKSGVILD